VADRLAGGGLDGGGAAEVGEGRFGGDPVGVVAGSDEQPGGGESANPVEGDEARRSVVNELGEFAVEAGAVGVDVDHPAAEGLHR
jgi:hypothetical protein